MREGGFEPPIPVGNQILNLARLPVPPLSLTPLILAVASKPLKRLKPMLRIQFVYRSHPRLTRSETIFKIVSPPICGSLSLDPLVFLF